MVCLKVDINLEVKLIFDCDEEFFGLCGIIKIVLCI